MHNSLKNTWLQSRREWFHKVSLLGLPALLPARFSLAQPDAQSLRIGSEIYQSIGVRPLINGRGTFTIMCLYLMMVVLG